MAKNWLVVGICGVTCGGKTSLVERLKERFPGSVIIAQDDYFRLPEAPEQVIIPELNHPNFELITSLDMAKMREDVRAALDRRPTKMESGVLILDGFSLYRDSWLVEVCHLKFFITLDKDECRRRRMKRVYEPPDPPGYFDVAVWPEYERILAEAKATEGIQEVDGAVPQDETAAFVVAKIKRHLVLR